jgi:predicted nucleotide-binding protein
MTPFEELFGVAKRLTAIGERIDQPSISEPLEALKDAANEVKKSFSGSWLGYHSLVYYQGLQPAPAGANFSQEWGLKDTSLTRLGSRGKWEQFQFDEVVEHIHQMADEPDLTEVRSAAKDADTEFSRLQSEASSILQTVIADKPDAFLSKLHEQLEALEAISKGAVSQQVAPRGQIMTRDTLAAGQGNKVPPHVDVLADIVSIQNSFGICKAAAEICTKAASHIERQSRRKAVAQRVGTNVFIGHGRSSAWRELKDFVQDRLALPWDEFNRVPVAGVTNIARLSEMLDAAAIGLLVMTAEDELADGGVQARMNVVHEAGLFQGRLGFTKAIVLLEEGCHEFSNIQGLGQIRFPKGKISAAFEEVRRVLEREGLIT